MIQKLPLSVDIESPRVLKKLAETHRSLAELKGVISTIPNENVLVETLTLREARESTAIENIFSTYDEVYQSNVYSNLFASPQAKEVHLYAEALKKGFELIRQKGILSLNIIKQIHRVVEQNDAGFRKQPGTKLLNDRTGEVVFTPPQDPGEIEELMSNLEIFINDESQMDIDPLLKMAVIHHQFESIHPFYDGNGRTGRIINILYLVQQNLLTLPVLYMSRYIISTKSDYYRLLQEVRDKGIWENWLLYILQCVRQTADESIVLVNAIRNLMATYKQKIRNQLPKIYSQDLLNNLFSNPYTRIELVQRDLGVSRSTAIRYLEALVNLGIIVKHKKGRDNFFVNQAFFRLLTGEN